MKSILTAAFLLIAFTSIAQPRLVPAKNVVDKKWMTAQKYQMVWYALRDTAKYVIGKVTTEISKAGNNVMVITRVDLARRNSTWIDSTIASATDLSPIYHSSYNLQRDMVLNFGKVVSGYYADKAEKSTTLIEDTVERGYFDSNIYPTLITWLPLQEGYKKDISIYDYNPAGKTGILKASVDGVHKGTYHSEISGDHEVWIVSVSDEIGGGEGRNIYYIDVADRKLWRQEILAGGRKMLMLRVEN